MGSLPFTDGAGGSRWRGRPRAFAGKLAALVVFLGGVGIPKAGLAAELPRVAVAPFVPLQPGIQMDRGDKIARLLVNELRSSEQLLHVELPAAPPAAPVAADPTPEFDEARLVDARARLARVPELMHKLEFAAAATELERAIAHLEAQHPYADFGALDRAYLDLAVCYVRLHRDAEANAMLGHFARLGPERRLDPERYPPVFQRRLDEVVKRLEAGPRPALVVEPTRSGSNVFLDGRRLGRAPVRVTELIKGRHYLKLVPPAGKIWGNVIEVPAGGLQVAPAAGEPISATEQLTGLLSRNVVDDALVTRLRAIAGSAADYVVFGGLHEEGGLVVVSSQLLQVSSGRVSALQRIAVDAELMSANLEVYQIGADVVSKVERFEGAVRLPVPIAEGLKAAPPRSLSWPALPPPEAEPEGGAAATWTAVTPAFGPQATPTLRAVEAVAVGAEPVGGLDPAGEPLSPVEPEEVKPDSGSRVWIWVAVGAAAVAGGVAGGYLYYHLANRQVTGTATVSW